MGITPTCAGRWQNVWPREATGGGSDEALRADQRRPEAIGREYHAKVAGLRRKYAMSVEVRFPRASSPDSNPDVSAASPSASVR